MRLFQYQINVIINDTYKLYINKFINDIVDSLFAKYQINVIINDTYKLYINKFINDIVDSLFAKYQINVIINDTYKLYINKFINNIVDSLFFQKNQNKQNYLHNIDYFLTYVKMLVCKVMYWQDCQYSKYKEIYTILIVCIHNLLYILFYKVNYLQNEILYLKSTTLEIKYCIQNLKEKNPSKIKTFVSIIASKVVKSKRETYAY
eukprot:TRINITY_DN24008_c0_g1_i2.p1 TRINITY_DN24008_c0_g1~~TRINITY_DN24008_c0_g1_i2.p1  ORF type:complete len:205 (-),score=-19.47 TRINITY_DN24008_c0_g1_i2:306-920(-)